MSSEEYKNIDEKIIKTFFVSVLYNTILEIRANAAINRKEELFKAMNMMHNIPKVLLDDSNLKPSFEWFLSWLRDEKYGSYLQELLNDAKKENI